mmetsp:Transcript_111588/g.271097  ORF Transcript_111588/g.271097 Transcript_111588/m.271097 type:complete len:232 (-) Transcript_111588:186-881(-)
MFGSAMWMFKLWLWQMKAPRSAAWSMITFCLISHTVLYRARSSAGMAVMRCTLPLSAIIWRRTSLVHRSRSTRSRSKCLFTTANSPASTRRLYMLDVNGSMPSLLPRICAVEAVGMGAINSELRRPCSAILAFRPAQFHRLVGVTPHMSNCSCPLLAGEPAYVSYGPSFSADSIDDSSAAKYSVSKISRLSAAASGESNGMRSSTKVSARPWTPMPTGRWRMLERFASSIG